MDINRVIKVALLLAAAVAVFVILNTVSLPTDTHLWAEIHNFGHTPLFGGLALVLLGLSVLLLHDQIPTRVVHYLFAFAVAFTLGLISEITQIVGPRDADLWDQVRNTAGIVGFLGIRLAADRKVPFDSRWWGRSRAALVRWIAILILVASVMPSILWADAYMHRKRHFPTLCAFEYYQERMFIRPHQTEVDIDFPPGNWYSNTSGNAARVTFLTEATYPGFVLSDPFPDWSGFDLLAFEVYSEIDTAIHIYMTIEDDHHNRQYEDRFNRSLTIRPGINQIEIPLREVRAAPKSRPMDMKAIASVNIFGYEPKTAFSLWFDDFRLK
jgi:hypothetical protein